MHLIDIIDRMKHQTRDRMTKKKEKGMRKKSFTIVIERTLSQGLIDQVEIWRAGRIVENRTPQAEQS